MYWEFDGKFFLLRGIEKFEVMITTRLTPKGLIPHYIGLKQIHSADIHVIESIDDIPEKGSEGDGLITSIKHLRIGVRTADCYPVFLMDEEKGLAGILHAGWRGSYKGIVRRGISIFINRFHSSIKDIKVAFGPGICGKCYEVGPDLLDFFPREFFRIRDGKLYLDILEYNLSILKEFGIEQILYPPACTFEDDRLFSYRRNRDESRLISTIMIR